MRIPALLKDPARITGCVTGLLTAAFLGAIAYGTTYIIKKDIAALEQEVDRAAKLNRQIIDMEVKRALRTTTEMSESNRIDE